MTFRSRCPKALTLKYFFHKKNRFDFETSQIHNKRLNAANINNNAANI